MGRRGQAINQDATPLKLLGAIGQRRVVQDNAQVAFIVFHIPPGLVYRGDLAVFVSHADIAHGHGRVAVQLNTGILDLDLSPAHQREARVACIVFVTTHEVGQSAFLGCTESLWCNMVKPRLEFH